MSITSSGAVCDICGSYILPIPGQVVKHFRLEAIPQELHAHPLCYGQLINISATSDDWRQLPDGPIRRAFVASEVA